MQEQQGDATPAHTTIPDVVAVRACKRNRLWLQTSRFSAQIHCTRDQRSAHDHGQRTHIHCTLLANICLCSQSLIMTQRILSQELRERAKKTLILGHHRLPVDFEQKITHIRDKILV
jgi:hypothetical protein